MPPRRFVFQDLLPEGLRVVREIPSEIEGLTLVELNDGSFVYVFDGKPYFFSGNLYRFSESGISNLSEAFRSEQRVDILGSIDPSDAVTFPASGPAGAKHCGCSPMSPVVIASSFIAR